MLVIVIQGSNILTFKVIVIVIQGSNILTFKVIVIVIQGSNILIFKVIVIVIMIYMCWINLGVISNSSTNNYTNF